MAGPLTWRDVSAPNFSASSESQKTAALLLSQGIGGFSDALGQFQDTRSKTADNEFLAGLAQQTDPNAADQYLRNGANMGNVSAEALQFGMGRQKELLANEGTRENNAQTAWGNGVKQSYEAARPAAVDAVNQIRSLASLGTPEGKAQAHQLMKESSGVLSAAGMSPEDVMNMVNGNVNTANIGLASNDAFQKQGDANTSREQRQAAQTEFNRIFKNSASPADMESKVRSDPNLDPDVAGMILGAIGEKGEALFGGDVDPSRSILDQRIQEQSSSRIEYANQGAKRNKPLSKQLTKAISPILDDLGITMKVVSGGQVTKAEAAAGKGSRTGGERHDHGDAGDVDFYAADGHKLSPSNPKDIPILQEIVRRGRANGITGWGEGADYMGDGRVHIGFGAEAAWGAGGKSANAPQWLKDAMGSGPLGSVPTDNQPQNAGQEASDAITRALNISAQGATSADNQSLLTAGNVLTQQAQTLTNVMGIDEAFNRTASTLEVLSGRPDKNLDEASVAKKLYSEVGDDDGLPLDDLTDQLNRVTNKYGISSDIAATIMKEALEQTTWGARWLKGDIQLDQKALDQHFRRFIDVDAKTVSGKMQPSMELYRAMQAKRDGAANLQQMQSDVEKAQKEYFKVRERAANRPQLKGQVEAALLRYQTILGQSQKMIEQLDENPLMRGNIGANTGR